MVSLRDYMEERPPTAQTFTLADLEDWDYRMFDEDMLTMAGTWKLPDPAAPSRSSRSDLYINPNYEHKNRFPEVWEECECGAVLTRSYNDGENRYEAERQHQIECRTQDRLRCRANLLDQRERVLRRGLLLGRSGRQLAPQIGLAADGIGEISKALRIDMDHLKDIYREKAGRTYVKLVADGVSAELVAGAYGCHVETLSRRARKLTEYTYDHNIRKWRIEA